VLFPRAGITGLVGKLDAAGDAAAPVRR